jgi:hypothetical protein
MKKVFFILFVSMLGFSCSKKSCDSIPTACADQVPTGMTCTAAFQSWIYNSDKRKCELKSYSGCNAVGFETKEACELCDCKK